MSLDGLVGARAHLNLDGSVAMLELSEAGAEMFTLLVYGERAGVFDINFEDGGWAYRFSDRGAEIAEALGLDPRLEKHLHFFTLLLARCDSRLPGIVSDAALVREWEENIGTDLFAALDKAQKALAT